MITRMRKYFLVFGIVYVLILVTGGSTVHALTTGPSIITLPNPLNPNTIAGLITQITSALAIIAVPIVGVAIIFGAYQILFAGGDPEKFKTGTRTIWYAIIAYVIILVALGSAKLIENILGGTP